jgi:predicted amino acid-binding ACT domain protein
LATNWTRVYPDDSAFLPDRMGIVHAVSGFLLGNGGNISGLHNLTAHDFYSFHAVLVACDAGL